MWEDEHTQRLFAAVAPNSIIRKFTPYVYHDKRIRYVIQEQDKHSLIGREDS